MIPGNNEMEYIHCRQAMSVSISQACAEKKNLKSWSKNSVKLKVFAKISY